ncbi:MAG: hypothetical protein R2733_20170 [Acidimicrobiales bacterium]
MRLNKRMYRPALLAGAIVLLAGCRADTTEPDVAAADLRAAQAEIVEVQVELDTSTATIESLEDELDTATASLEAEQEAAGELRETVERLEGEVAAGEAELRELRLRFDPEIKAAAQTAWDVELPRACAEAGAGTGLIASYVDHTDEMEAVGTRAELIDAVTACAEPLRSRTEAEKLDAECTPGDVDAVLRDTDSFAGSCLVMFVIPWQWDSRTGECAFLGSWDPNNLGVRYRYKYDGDGVFRADPSVCAEGLADADQDDLLKVWATATGTFRYDTAAGGTNEIPDFTIRKVELVAKG